MIRFNCDYNEGACPEILERLVQTNWEQTPGYGEDDYCAQAAQLIRALCKAPQAAVHLLVGGTQTNLTVIAAALRPHQCVLTAGTGHINVHETGAIEACGHKVVALASGDGKLTARQIQEAYDSQHNDSAFEHITQPKMVYLSHPTELGTIYTLAELEAISAVCRQNGLYLFLDGARLGYGLAAEGSDVDLPALARLCDAFYLGGTKQGALFGEAVVLTHPALQEDFRYLMKQKGGLLAKGRLLGIQFLTLLEGGDESLYLRLARHADRLAMKLRDALAELGVALLLESPTNQQFPILPDALLAELEKSYAFSYQQRVDPQHSAVRICTSWATKEENLDQLIADLRRLIHK